MDLHHKMNAICLRLEKNVDPNDNHWIDIAEDDLNTALCALCGEDLRYNEIGYIERRNQHALDHINKLMIFL